MAYLHQGFTFLQEGHSNLGLQPQYWLYRILVGMDKHGNKLPQ